MIDWYKQYDRETFMQDFTQLEFRKFNPYYKLDKEGMTGTTEMPTSLNGSRDEFRNNQPPPVSIFEDSNALSQMFF